MPLLKNLHYGPITLERDNDVPLTIGPRETINISEKEFDNEGVQRYFRDGTIVILSGDEPPEKKPNKQQPPNKPIPLPE
ncbi:MAG TPA: hypothetical protein VNA19_09365 [Pyrinomonadaceae bacterium]|jgi:hypothetical protein|nr:hypothetical protein [Pyrinomonadaceae bacterium]